MILSEEASHRVRFVVMCALLAALIALFVLAAGSAGAATPAAAAPASALPATRPAPRKASELFDTTAVWSVHLTFTPAQWEAMEPMQDDNARAQRRRGDLSPSGLLAPTMMRDADTNHDSKVSREEFAALAGKWFEQWDKANAGRLNAASIRAGLEGTLAPAAAQFGPGPRLQGPEGKRNGLAAANGIEFDYVHADLDFQGQVIKDVAVRYKGNGTYMNSRGSLKHSIKVDLNRYVDGQKFAGVAKLNFHNNVTDPSWMNEVLSHRLYRDAGVPAPRTSYARVYISVAGKYDHKYLGLYSIVEDIDSHFAKDRFGTREGAIFKPVTPNLFADLGNDWNLYKQTYDPKTDLSQAQQQRIIDFCRLLTTADDEEFAAKVAQFVDLDETARYLGVTVYLSTLDSILAMGQNFYMYLDPASNRLSILPWDLDHSFGQFPMMSTQEAREQLSILHPWRGDNRFLDRLFKVDAFRKIYLAKMAEFDKTIFKPQRFLDQVDQVAAAIRPAVQEESPAMLERFDRVVAGNSPDVAGALGQLFGRGRGATKPIKGFVVARSRSISQQLSGASSGQVIEGGDFGRRGLGGAVTVGAQLAPAFVTALDANHDGQVSREEFVAGFSKWFAAWDKARAGSLTSEQLAAGINSDLGAGSQWRGRNGPPGRNGGRGGRFGR